MPALTHGRVKNGFNGGIKKENNKKYNHRAANNGSQSRKNDLVGGIGGKSLFVQNAIKKGVSKCDC